MKIAAVLVICGALVAGCGRSDNRGGAGGEQNPPITGRGAGNDGDNGGNGKAYDRGGPPWSTNPSSQKPGSGRVDQGGGQTSGGKIDNSVPTNHVPSGASPGGGNLR